jgi:hypothetical protein
MFLSRLLASLILTGPFLATSVFADAGDYILGGGVSADNADGVALIALTEVGVTDKTWLSGSVGRTNVGYSQRQDLETWYAYIGVDHFWKPVGGRLGVAYWGDSSLLDSVDVVASIYTRGKAGMISFDAEHRDFELELPPLDFLPQTLIPFKATGFGLSGRLTVSPRASLRLAGMRYEYNVDFRAEDAARASNLLSVSRLSLLSSLIDWRVSAGIGVDFGTRRLELGVAKWRGAIDGGDNRSVTVTFLTPITDRTDLELSLGLDDSDLYGDVTVFNVFVYFYGGD